MNPNQLLISAWATWGLSWFLASAWTGRTEKRVAPTSREVWAYRTPLIIGMVLLHPRTAERLDMGRLWPGAYPIAYALALITIAGFLLTWWARLHLGRLWSGSVTRKEGHHIVDTGPYAIVRHPIYTGLLLATVSTATALGTGPALLGAAFIVVGFRGKGLVEERFLAAELGDAYGAYRKRVPMLLPFGPVAK